MDNQLIFDSSEQAGFRLNTLQLCNWGVLQNDKIFTFDFNNKSTLLTGRNGSGKTTIVDAIITLFDFTTNLHQETQKTRNVMKKVMCSEPMEHHLTNHLILEKLNF